MAAAKTVIGGDDTRAIIADCGSWVVRLGSAGDDTPRSIIPCATGTRPTRKRHPPADDPPAAATGGGGSGSGSGGDAPGNADVVMSDGAGGGGATHTAKAADPHAEYTGTGLAHEAQRPCAGDVLLTSPLAFSDVQPVYATDAATGAATVRSWDGMQAVWEAGCAALRLDPRQVPLLLVEPTRMWSEAERAQALERAFEGVGVPAAYVGRGAAMAAFSSARTTACVVDAGGQGACAVPVVDGYVMKKAAQMTAVGGYSLSEKVRQEVERQLEEKGVRAGVGGQRLRAHHEVKRERLVSDAGAPQFRFTDLSETEAQRGLSESHRAFYRLKVIEDVKAYTLRVSQGKTVAGAGEEGNGVGNGSKSEASGANGANGAGKGKGSETSAGADASREKGDDNGGQEGSASSAQKGRDKQGSGGAMSASGDADPSSGNYTLPDGNVINLGADTRRASPADDLFTTSGASTVSLTELAFRAVSACDVDARRDLYGGVVLTGGTSLVGGVLERLTRELAVRTPQMYKLKLLAAPGSVERSCGAWIGGSIVASLGTFQQAWVSRAEYDELGSRGALRKCP